MSLQRAIATEGLLNAFMNVLLGDRMVMNYMPTLLSAFTVGGVVWLLHKCNLQRPCEEREINVTLVT